VLNGVKLSSQGRLWRMAPESVDATIAVGKKPGVELQELTLGTLPDTLSAPPFSISIYSYVLQ
jgi:alpha-L-arabinofuranosidase